MIRRAHPPIEERPGAGPTVVFVNGCAMAREHWEPVLDELPGRRLITFDRPGMGETRWDRRISSLADDVASLRQVVAGAGEPVVLVAHSMASFHAEALARQSPELVAAVVLVDPSVEWPTVAPRVRTERLPALALRWARRGSLDHLGVLFHRWSVARHSVRGLRDALHPRLRLRYRDPDTLGASLAEALSYDREAWDLLAVRRAAPMPAVPVRVLTALELPETHDWVSRHARFAQLLGGSQIVVPDSRHLMMLDRPDVIARAVESVIAEMTTPGRP